MTLRLPRPLLLRLIEQVYRAGLQETGGVLMGEALPGGDFRIADFSAASRPGGRASFMRSQHTAALSLASFFQRTGHQFSRFNYLGEWHSHPGFSSDPSEQDRQTMQGLVEAKDFAGAFAVLVIVATDIVGDISVSATVFPRGGDAFRAAILLEEQTP